MNHLQVRFCDDNKLEAGVDEAGRGCLWGPLYAAAVIWPPEEDWLDEHREVAPFIKDSKKISAKKRKQIANQIQAAAIDYGIGSVSAKEIDQSGMTSANRLAFQRAIEEGADTTAIVAEKQRLRDITQLADTATTLEELKGLSA